MHAPHVLGVMQPNDSPIKMRIIIQFLLLLELEEEKKRFSLPPKSRVVLASSSSSLLSLYLACNYSFLTHTLIGRLQSGRPSRIREETKRKRNEGSIYCMVVCMGCDCPTVSFP